MKKFFGGKKKKKSKPASFNSADSDFQANDTVPRKLVMSQSTDQPRLAMTNDTNNNNTIINTINNSNSNKGLIHSKSQGIMKTTIPTQPAMTKRLNRPTSSPPALVMPRPRYAEPPTRAVLKSFEHEKTLLDMDPTQLQQPLLTGQGYNNDDDHGKRKVYGNNIGNPSAASLTVRPPIPSTTVSTPSRSQKMSPTTDIDLLPQYDTKPAIKNKKSLDSAIAAVMNTKKHESMNSITGSDDSNRVYESALESPMMTSTSTILDHSHQSHTTNESAFGSSQLQRHSSPSVLSGTLVPQLLPPTASDSSETVTPAGSTNQQPRTIPPEQPTIINAISNMNIIRSVPDYSNSDHILTPTTSTRQHPSAPSPNHKHQKSNGALQQLHPSQDLESLQQQVLLIQQQREMDRVEYERMEQVHKERTQWMKAEIDRTQSKLLELAASKRATISSQQHVDNLPPSHADEKENDYYNDAGKPTASTFQRQQYEQHHTSANSTSFRSQKSIKSSTNLARLSRSSSKASNGGGSSSSGGQSYRLKGDAQLKPDMLGRDAVVQKWDSSTAEFMTTGDQPAYTNGNISRQSSGRKSQQSQHSQHHHYQQDLLPPQATPSTPRSRPRDQRPRSKSTESRPPMNPENDNHSDPNDERLYDRQPSRPQSNSNRRRYHQRSVSVERPYPYYYDTPYFYPPTGAHEDDMENGDEMDVADEDEADEDEYRYMDLEYRYPQQQQQQQHYDSFPPRHHQRMRSYYQQSPYMSGPMTFMPPPPPLGQPPPIHRQRMAPSQMQQEFYGYDGPPSYYSNAPPPTRRRQLPPGMMPNDDGYWSHSAGGGGGPSSSFNRYPPPQVIPPYMRMDDPQRQSYWRSRPPPPSEYAM